MASACGWTCPDDTVPTADAAPADAAAGWLRCGGRALFGGLAMLFVYAVEDQFFVTTLRAEVDRQRLHRSTHGAWAAPPLPFISLYAQGQGLPADLARQRAAHVIFGTAYDQTLGDQLRVTVNATGLSSVRAKAHVTGSAPPLTGMQQPMQPMQQTHLRSGTDNLPILNQVASTAHGSHGPTVTVQPQHSYKGFNTPSVWRSARHRRNHAHPLHLNLHQ